MRYSASEKFEIIELVEQSSLSIRRTLAPIGIPRSTFYDWYNRYQEGGIEALVDGKPRPRRIWNKIPDKIETAIINLALEEPDLSPRELAVNFTDTKGSFVSEASVYRLLKDHGLITSPAFILMKAADRFANPTTAPNQLWQTDFTYLKVIGWGWFYLSTVLDDFSRYILAWKLCTTMSATDVSDTLQVALRGSGLNQVKVLHRPRLLSDNGPSYVSSELGEWLEDNGIRHIRGRPYHPMTQGKIERYHRSMKNRILLENYYLPGQLEQRIEEFVEYYNRASEHPSCYVIEEKRLCWPGCDPAGYLGFCRARSVIDRAADVVSAARAKIHGPSARGWIASISPASAASRSVLGAICRSFAALLRLSHGSIPSSAGLNTGMR
jgi:putative transposase